jgi:hypothetical protein
MKKIFELRLSEKLEPILISNLKKAFEAIEVHLNTCNAPNRIDFPKYGMLAYWMKKKGGYSFTYQFKYDGNQVAMDVLMLKQRTIY